MNSYEASIKDPSSQQVALSFDLPDGQPIPKVFVVCDQRDTAPVWGYILRQRRLNVVLETSLERAADRWASELADLVVIDIDISRHDPVVLCRRFREVSLAPLLLFLPTHHETQILDAYAAGVDDIVVKPIGPALFLAKIMAWVRRSWMVPVDEMSLVNAGGYKLDPGKRCMINPNGREIKLTNLELRLLLLLMSRRGHVFSAEDIIQSIWGGLCGGDQVPLKNVVYRLRKKIEVDHGHPILLQTGQGGYFFHG